MAYDNSGENFNCICPRCWQEITGEEIHVGHDVVCERCAEDMAIDIEETLDDISMERAEHHAT